MESPGRHVLEKQKAASPSQKGSASLLGISVTQTAQLTMFKHTGRAMTLFGHFLVAPQQHWGKTKGLTEPHRKREAKCRMGLFPHKRTLILESHISGHLGKAPTRYLTKALTYSIPTGGFYGRVWQCPGGSSLFPAVAKCDPKRQT